jgi:hypothetical protein
MERFIAEGKKESDAIGKNSGSVPRGTLTVHAYHYAYHNENMKQITHSTAWNDHRIGDVLVTNGDI